MNSISILGIGLVLGLRHATDADHVVAVTAIVSKQKKLSSAALVGISWGIGHTIMVILVGIGLIYFHVSIPENLQMIFELIVALTLITLGILNLTGNLSLLMKYLSNITLPHGHTHTNSFITTHGVFHLVRPLIVGLIHGLAGSAAVTLLVLSSISDERSAIIYLGIFGIGTIIGMMLITTLIGLPFIFSQSKFQKLDRVFSTLAGVFSILYGLYYGYTILLTS